MDFIIEQALKNIPDSPTLLDSGCCRKIYSTFPVPREQKIKWAELTLYKNRLCGIVLSDKGIFLKGFRSVDKPTNNMNDRNEDEPFFQYIRWEFFNIDDFDISDETSVVKLGGAIVSNTQAGFDFFRYYKRTYDNIVKSSAVTSADTFAVMEAVVPENYSKENFKQGHGQMAEEALTLLDKFAGKNAELLGRKNDKDGPDRVVEGVYIQTKFHETGKGCIDDCFDSITGAFRYIDDTGNIMQIEVPKDKYAEALNEFRKKILEGCVPGVTDPNDASNYVKQSKLTYQQAVNLCKPLTVESLAYDAATGVVTCSFTFGISFLATFIIQYTQTGDRNDSMECALAAGIQVFGLSFFSHIFVSQVARTTLTKQLIPLSEYLVQKMGHKTVQVIVNAIRSMAGKGTITGAAAMKQLAKILRSNTITSAITFLVFSIPDTFKMFNQKLSNAQYTKNMLSLVGAMVGAGGGTLGASIAAAKIGALTGTAVAPGLGTVIGVTGGLLGGLVIGTATKMLGDIIREDDAIILSRMFNGVVANMIYEYMLIEPEIDVLIEKFNTIKHKEFKKLFESIQAADSQEIVIVDYIRHYFEDIICTRIKVIEPKPEDLVILIENFNFDNGNSSSGILET